MRFFFATGEASGEQTAILLAGEIRRLDPTAVFEGIGGEMMAAAGFKLAQTTAGWASLGLVSALGKIPKFLAVYRKISRILLNNPPDILVLIDFGAFHLRLARALRRRGYRGEIIYAFPPGAWLDRASQVNKVALATTPLIPFEHQAEFFRSLGFEARCDGHPLSTALQPRLLRADPSADGGRVALLPGSREGELRYHVPLLLETFAKMRRTRPYLTGVFAAADTRTEHRLDRAIALVPGLRVERGARKILSDCDVAIVASGTAVLEAALLETPCIAYYILSAAQARLARRIWKKPYVTLPNLVLNESAIPEFLQDRAKPDAIAEAALQSMANPRAMFDAYRRMRKLLGADDALETWAQRIVTAARSAAG